ncbi:MAG: ABC transporter ATP-binding protein [Bacteroidota bacterium]
MLEVNGINKSFDGQQQVLVNCSFQLALGKIGALVGESGSGKSTLLRLIAGLERPDAGQISIDGQCVTNDVQLVPPQRRQVGMVFQDYALFPHLTVAENIGFAWRKAQPERVRELLALVQLPGLEKRYPHELSGGQEQRIALARALAATPKLLLLDEPFSNLDQVLKAELRPAIAQIVRQLGLTLLFITHDLTDALDIADELLFLHEGQLLHDGPIQQLDQPTVDPRLREQIRQLQRSAQQVLNATNLKST